MFVKLFVEAWAALWAYQIVLTCSLFLGWPAIWLVFAFFCIQHIMSEGVYAIWASLGYFCAALLCLAYGEKMAEQMMSKFRPVAA